MFNPKKVFFLLIVFSMVFLFSGNHAWAQNFMTFHPGDNGGFSVYYDTTGEATLMPNQPALPVYTEKKGGTGLGNVMSQKLPTAESYKVNKVIRGPGVVFYNPYSPKPTIIIKEPLRTKFKKDFTHGQKMESHQQTELHTIEY